MRRLILNGRFVEGPETAVNAVARQLSQALARTDRGWSVTLAVPPRLAPRAAELGLPLRIHGYGGGAAWDQIHLPALRRDGVVAGFFNTVPLRGRGYVTLLHDAHVFTTPASYPPLQRLWRQQLARQAGQAGNHLLTVSADARDQIRAQGIGADDIGVVPNGPGPVVTTAPDDRILARLGLGEGPFCLAFGTLAPHKNIAVLTRAFADPRLAGVRLVLVGTADAAAFRRAGISLSPNVVLAGRVDDPMLAALYGQACATCVPSTAEGFGLPVLESMWFGTPVVTSGLRTLVDLAGQGGVVASASDPGAWVRAITGLIADPSARAGIGAHGRDRSAQFTWDRAADQVIDHLNRWFSL